MTSDTAFEKLFWVVFISENDDSMFESGQTDFFFTFRLY